jgi:predicted outer membrane repeat protein
MKTRLFPIASAFLLFLSAVPAFATTVVGTGTPASCTEASLNAAINEANATFGIVTFDCGPAQKTILLSSEKPLANGVIIDGGGKIVLSGQDSTRIFNLFLGAAVEIHDIALIGGRADHGGCVLAFGTSEQVTQLRLHNVSLRSCAANNFGGAVAGFNSILTVSSSSIESSYAGGGGGGISLNQGTLVVDDSRFFLNGAENDGGAVQAWFSEVTIGGSDFYSNNTFSTASSGGGGGALTLLATVTEVRDSTFYNNGSARQGGAVQAVSSTIAYFYDTRFEYGSANGGGAVYLDFATSVNCERCSFSNNVSFGGGGAILSTGTVLARNSTFYSNHTGARGGAVMAVQGAIYLANATLAANVNLNDGNAGQIAWDSNARVEVHNSLIQALTPLPIASCSPAGVATVDFTFSIWPDSSCPAGIGSQSLTDVPLRPFGFSCGGTATELTRTLPLAAAGPAVDGGFCRPGDPLSDQRGMPRPGGALSDVGAAEFFEPCDAPLFANGFESGTTSGWSLTLP